jgi:hypothetical protein
MSYCNWTPIYDPTDIMISIEDVAEEIGFDPTDYKCGRHRRNPRIWNGRGRFRCYNCRHSWTSYKAPVQVNWKNLTIPSVYKQLDCNMYTTEFEVQIRLRI